MNVRQWSSKEDRALLAMVAVGFSRRAIAAALDCPKTSIGTRLEVLACKGITPDNFEHTLPADGGARGAGAQQR